MVQAEEKTTKKFIELPPKNKDKDRILEKICYGNSRIGKLLDYFIYGANQDAGYHGLEGCNVVTLTDRKHDAIMEKLPFNVSRKTLICHLNLLNKWGYVLSEPYSRDFAVHKDKILEAISNPPEKPKRPYYNRHPEKGCNSTTLQPSENEESADSEKCVTLHNNVVEGNNNVVTLHKKVDILLQLQPHLETLVEMAEAYKNDPYSNNSNIPVITGDIEAIASHPLFQSLFETVNLQAKQIAELQSQSSKQEPSGDTNVPNLTAPTTSTQSTTVTNSDIRDNPSTEHADTSSSAHGMEHNTDVEQKSIQDKQSNLIAKVTTENTEGLEEKKDIVGLAIREVEQVILIEVPDNSPVIPSESMPWNAEKMVQITEAKRFVRGKQGARFSDAKQGKNGKSQRDRQKDASRKILALGITEDQYVMAYDDCNTEWWNDNQGSLTVETMLAKTPRKIIRVIELLEKIESKGSSRIISFQDRQPKPEQPAKHIQPTHEELRRSKVGI